jgi:glycosyltransferase involved in cell wall biosynthesis
MNDCHLSYITKLKRKPCFKHKKKLENSQENSSDGGSHQAKCSLIVIDKKSATEAADEVKKFESEYTGRVRVRCMPKNMGASPARNRGIEESAADWILFLGDDVEPEVDILHQYALSIKTHGSRTCGFVGLTSFPRSDSGKIANAAYMSHILYFWSISERFPEQAVGWGVTANLPMRRTDVRFRTDFPKTAEARMSHSV